MTKTQELNQCHGPHRPSPRYLAVLLDSIPKHHEIIAVSINGQANRIIIETWHEGFEQVHEFEAHE